MENITEKIIKASKIEEEREEKRTKHEESIKFRNDSGISENALINPIFPHYIISLNDEPIFVDKFKSFDPTVRYTRGCYAIRYLSHADKRRKGKYKNYAFQIMQDLVSSKIQVANYKHWLQLCKTMPEFAWLNRNCSELRSELFDLAAQHPGIAFWFGIDLVEYAKKINEKIKAQGRETGIKNKVFVNFVCSMYDYNKYYKDLKVFETPSRNDIIKQMKEANYEQE